MACSNLRDSCAEQFTACIVNNEYTQAMVSRRYIVYNVYIANCMKKNIYVLS